MKKTLCTSLVGIAASISLSQAAVVSWGPVGTGIQVGDLITSGTLLYALNGGADAAGIGTTSNGVLFAQAAPITAAVTGAVSNTGNGGFYSPTTGDAILDTVMDSHTYISTANPNGNGQLDLIGLTPGNIYEVQMIAVGDDRGCCATRTQFVDDGNGNMSGAMTRGTGDWVVGTFTATAATESFFVTGATDPGLSGLVLRDITAVPEPSGALLALLGLAGFGMRRRRK